VVELAKAGQDTVQAPTLILPAGLKFNAEQLSLLSGMREQAIERSRVLADRAEKERHEATGQQLYADLLNGNMPSDEKLKTLVASGDLDPNAAYNFRSLREGIAESARARAEREEDRAEQAANRRADEAVANIAMEWNVGDGPNSMAEFQAWARRNMPTLGTGANRAQNYSMLYGVVQRKLSLTTSNPEFKMYNTKLGDLFPTATSGIVAARGGDNNKNLRLQAQLDFRRMVENDTSPRDAFLEVARKYGREGQAKASTSLLMVNNSLSEMEERRRQAGIQ
jgi:hypothetical protein